jgi:error-prone DNA polymerase
MLLEDEHGTVNLIVPPALYERRRHIVRAEPLILAHGRLERPPPAAARSTCAGARELRTLDDERSQRTGGRRSPRRSGRR